MKTPPWRVAALIFPGFEVLDLFGPLEPLSMTGQFSTTLVAEQAGEIESAQGVRVVGDADLTNLAAGDLVLVPGGRGTREQVDNPALLDWLRTVAPRADIVASVCTGSALLARAGLLDGRRATTNKIAFDWVKRQGPQVDWVRKARWVEDGNIFTSSGVSAGMDMTLAVITRLLGRAAAEEAARRAEYVWNDDPADDPFATA